MKKHDEKNSKNHINKHNNNMTKEKNASENKTVKSNRRYAITGGALILAGIALLVIKGISAEYIDEAGILHENFFLIPAGFFCIFCGLMTFAALGIRKRISRSKGSDSKDESVQELFYQNEIQANMLTSLVAVLFGIGLIISWILNMIGVFLLDRITLTIFVLISLALLAAAIIVSKKCNGKNKWLKYYLLCTLVVICAILDALITYNIPLMILFPLVLSLRYYSEKYTLNIAVVTGVAFVISAALGSWFQLGICDLNFVDVSRDTFIPFDAEIYDIIENSGGFLHPAYFFYYMVDGLIPKMIQYMIFAVIAYLIAKRGKEMVVRQAQISAETSRIESELSIARNIQMSMLPNAFPAFPDRDEFEVYATMTPAKEVGGDFYDFFMVDERHLAIVIADVSGKGMPAALFMAIAKSMIKDNTEPERELQQTFCKVNNKLCESNSEGLFVTAFEGVLDLVTGEFVFVNAGHEAPYICRKGETFELYKLRPGFVLAGMEDTPYKAASVMFEPGDKLFQYTDGVTEATNADNEMYGQDRLTAVLKNNSNKTATDLIPAVRTDIDAFVGEAPQFDDLTMLGFEYKKRMEM